MACQKCLDEDNQLDVRVPCEHEDPEAAAFVAAARAGGRARAEEVRSASLAPPPAP